MGSHRDAVPDEADDTKETAVANETYTPRKLDEADQAVLDDLIDNMNNVAGDRSIAERATTRHDFAGIAMRIADDRYTAGSTAATITIICLLKFGTQAAINFAKDLDHHEGF